MSRQPQTIPQDTDQAWKHARVVFLACMVLLPFFYFRITLESYVLLKEGLIAALATALVFFTLPALQKQREFSFKWCALDTMIVAYVLLTLASVTLSVNRHESFLAWFQVPALAILYFFVSRFFANKADALMLFISGAATAVAVITLGMSVSTWLGLGQPGDLILQRLKGFLEIPLGGNNFTAAYLALALPFTAALSPEIHKRIFLYKNAAICIQSATVMVCLSRTAMACFGVFLLAWAGYAATRKILGRQWRHLVSAGSGVAIALLCFVVISGNATSRQVASDLMISPGEGTMQGIDSMHMRLFWWKDTVALIKDNPLGVGYGGFTYAFPAYRTIPERFILPETRLTTPHNDYLHVASETGYPGLALWVCLLGMGFYGAAAGLKREPETPSAFAAGGVLLNATLYGLVDFPLQMPVPRVLFIVALALSASHILEHTRRGRVIEIKNATGARLAAGAVFVLLLLLNMNWYKSFVAQIHVLREVQLQNSPAESIAEFYKAIHYDPQARFAYPFAGSAFMAMGDCNAASTMFQKAVQIDPNDYNAVNFLGVAFARCGRDQEAVAQFKKAAQIYDAFSSPHVNLGIMYMQHGQRNLAAQEFQEALARNDQLVEVYMELASFESTAGNFRAAALLLSRALEIEPGNPEIKAEISALHGKFTPGQDRRAPDKKKPAE